MQSAEKYTSLFHLLLPLADSSACAHFVSLAQACKKKHQSSRLQRLVPVVASRAPERAGLT